MDRNACPNCHASLDDDELASTGSAECPFCGEPLPEGYFGSDPETQQAVSASSETSPVAGGLPPQSKVSVVEASESRYVIFIPPGGKQTRSLGVFAVAWNGFMAAFTGIWISVGDDAPWVMLVLILGLFWAVGITVLIFWIRMRFTRTHLLLERDRIAIQRILFGRKSIAETFLGPDSKAELAEAYRSNNKPVYSVAVNGSNRTARFATALSRDEKLWFVETINGFLGTLETVAPGAEAEPSSPKRVVFEDITPEDLAADSEVRVHESHRDRLVFSLPVLPSGRVRTLIALFSLTFAVLWLGTTGNSAFRAIGDDMDIIDWVAVLISGTFTLAGVVPLLVAVFAIRGKARVDLSPETVGCHWGLGKIGYRLALPTPSVTHVMVAVPIAEKYARRESRRVPQSNDVKVCMLFAGTRMIPLTTFHDLRTAKEVAGLARGQLHRMGFSLEDE